MHSTFFRALTQRYLKLILHIFIVTFIDLSENDRLVFMYRLDVSENFSKLFRFDFIFFELHKGKDVIGFNRRIRVSL